MTSPAIDFYRKHPRAIEALATSDCIKPILGRAAPPAFVCDNALLADLAATTESFNLFSAIGVDAAEIRHSRFLAWLLDPKGSHGAGDAYLRAFLQALPADSKTQRFLKSSDVGMTEVHCEFDRIDIRIVNTAQRVICAVENKVRIDEGNGQLRRYRELLESKYPDWHRRMVFLTLKEDKGADTGWIATSYAQLLEIILANAPGVAIGDPKVGLAILFSDYQAVVDPNVEAAADVNIFKLLNLSRTELKHSHFLAWLLRPSGSHGLRAAFADYLIGVLEKRGVTLPARATDIDLTDAVVRRERERIDILLVSERHRLVVAIENKIDAREANDQLAAYHAFLSKHYAGDHLVRVFLDLRGRLATHAGYVSIGYSDLLPFFEAIRAQLPAPPGGPERVATIISHYAALLKDHLWIKRKTVWQLPVAVQKSCAEICRRHPKEVAALLGEVKAWQKDFGRNLEPDLYEIADDCFGPSFRFTWDLWYSFVPPAYDRIAELRSSGGDEAFNGRLLIYQFFVVPFGDSASVRRPGVFLDVKLIKASKAGESFKAKLHAAALLNPIFNRVRDSASIPRNDPLLNFEVCSFEEAVTCALPEIRRRIRHRMERFARSIHPELVEFFERQTADASRVPLSRARRKSGAIKAAC